MVQFLSLIVALVSVIIGLTECSTGVYRGYSEGFRVGYVQKVSRKGFCKSNEGELSLQSFGSRAATPGAISDTWAFSISDPKVVKKLEEVSISGKVAKLTYTQYWVKPWCLDTAYDVTGVDTQ